MKYRHKKGGRRGVVRRRNAIPRVSVVAEIPQEVRDGLPPQLPTWHAGKRGSPFVMGVDPLPNRSMLDAADESGEETDGQLQLGTLLDEWEAKHGALTAVELAQAEQDLDRRQHQVPRYRTAAHVLADRPPPETAAKLPTISVPRKVRGRADILPSFSAHMFHDALSVTVHAIAAEKILEDPRLIDRARKILERWISKQTPAPKPFLEWRKILAGTPQEIAAVALALTEESTRLRSSSPLGFVLSLKKRAEIRTLFGKKVARAAR
jgi:hypothetical protein